MFVVADPEVVVPALAWWQQGWATALEVAVLGQAYGVWAQWSARRQARELRHLDEEESRKQRAIVERERGRESAAAAYLTFLEIAWPLHEMLDLQFGDFFLAERAGDFLVHPPVDTQVEALRRAWVAVNVWGSDEAAGHAFQVVQILKDLQYYVMLRDDRDPATIEERDRRGLERFDWAARAEDLTNALGDMTEQVRVDLGVDDADVPTSPSTSSTP